MTTPVQPPLHPTAPTSAPAPKPTAAAPVPGATTGSLSAADFATEQEKDKSGAVPGVGPVSPAEAPLGLAETMEDLGIGPRTPYPTGSPPPPSETINRGQGIKGVTDKPVVKPGEVKGPAPQSPASGTVKEPR
jgi:hypothetical protein